MIILQCYVISSTSMLDKRTLSFIVILASIRFFLLTASILCSFVSVVFLISLLVYLTGSFCVNH